MEILDQMPAKDKPPRSRWQLIGFIRILGFSLITFILINNFVEFWREPNFLWSSPFVVFGFILLWLAFGRYHLTQGWCELKLSPALREKRRWRYVGILLPLFLVLFSLWYFFSLIDTFMFTARIITPAVYYLVPASIILIADSILIFKS